jgi:Ser/Thr protein kinase RdoA (MazF antagonist)
MAAKINVESSTHTIKELSKILSDYTTISIKSTKRLFGGYSGDTYRIELDTNIQPTHYVLKIISNGYTYRDAEFMCRTSAYLGSVGYRDCCLPILKMKHKRPPFGKKYYHFVSEKEEGGAPSILMKYVVGQPADKIMRDRPDLAPAVMRGIGDGLGRMHASSSGIDMVKAQQLGLRWYETDGGCTDVQDQYKDKVLDKIMADPDASQHEFAGFYKGELVDLKKEMQLVKDGKLDMGITHGDPVSQA